ncbi:MAG: PocR ligand-binding domain-containing protein, partial [Spirochaetales bacterium]|nr:PocR ligand-binding domain-containing protein [Spirochaetales bacterium]
MKGKSLLDQAREEAVHYTRATGMACFVIDDRGDSADSSLCAFCAHQLASGRTRVDCSGVHLYGAYQAERFGGRYFYFCPASFLHWASPILEEGKMVGALVGGPALMVEEDDVFFDNIAALGELSREEARELV